MHTCWGADAFTLPSCDLLKAEMLTHFVRQGEEGESSFYWEESGHACISLHFIFLFVDMGCAE